MTTADPVLAPELFETRDLARTFFAKRGATGFVCEAKFKEDESLPLKPTWQASTRKYYRLCIDIRSSLVTSQFNDFVTACVINGYPVHLWVVLPKDVGISSLGKQLKEAKERGIGVAHVIEDGTIHVHHEAVSLSLFGLRKTEPSGLSRPQWETISRAENVFFGGNPEGACQDIGQQVEDVTRKFAEESFNLNCWDPKAKAPSPALFTGNWDPMLEKLERDIIPKEVQKKFPDFKKNYVTRARAITSDRNLMSHAPKNLKERIARDGALRTKYENMRDVLVAWCAVARAFKLK
ncbi:MAG TPA: hypothetical protein VLC06_10630 [Polyangia bacterium]|jgi:hypothetical protein|nr:hypothetical protein [Polyangia bacterium]